MTNFHRFFASALFFRILGAGGVFLYNFVLARILSSYGLGMYQVALSIINIVVVISSLGFQELLVKHVSIHHERQDYGAAKSAYNKMLQMTLAAGIFFTLAVICFFSTGLGNDIVPNLLTQKVIAGMAFAIIPMLYNNLNAAFFRAIGKFQFTWMFNGVFVPAVSITLLLCNPASSAILYVVYSFAIANWIVLAIAFFYYKKTIKNWQPSSAATAEKTNWLYAAKGFYTLALIGVIADSSDILIVKYFLDNHFVGIYSIAQKTSLTIGFALAAVNSVVSPQISFLFAQRRIKELNMLINKTVRILLLGITPVLICLILFAGQIMGFFGNDFIAGKTALIIFCAGQLVNVATGPVGYLLMMCNEEWIFRNDRIFCTILTLVLCWILIPLYGINGAAIAVASSLIVQNLIAAYFVHKKLGISLLWRKIEF